MSSYFDRFDRDFDGELDERGMDEGWPRQRLAPGKRTLTQQLPAPTLAVLAAQQSPGSALPDALRQQFQEALGVNLGSVRVHTSAASARAASAVDARAYALGQDIHFAPGQYDPSSQAGRYLLAHEVAHTVQQQGGSQAVQDRVEVGEAGSPLEAEADRAAAAMTTGARTAAIGGVSSAAPGMLLQRYPAREPIEWATTPAPTQQPRPAGDADHQHDRMTDEMQFALNEVHANGLLTFVGMEKGLDFVMRTLTEPKVARPPGWASLVGYIAKAAIYGAKPYLGGLASVIAAPVGEAVTAALAGTQGEATAAPLALFEATLNEQITVARGVYTTFFWRVAAPIMSRWNTAELHRIALRFWQPEYVHAVRMFFQREVTIAWANFIAQLHHGSEGGGRVSTLELDDQNISDRSGYGDNSTGILNVEMHCSVRIEGEERVVNYRPHRIYVHGLPDALRSGLRKLTVGEAHLNTLIRLFGGFDTGDYAFMTIVVGPDGDILDTDWELGTERFDVANAVDTVLKLPLKVLE